MSHTLADRNPWSHRKHASHRSCAALCNHGSRSRASCRSLCSELQFLGMPRETLQSRKVSRAGVLANKVCETGGARPTCPQTVREKTKKTGGSSFATGTTLSERPPPKGPNPRIFTSPLRHWQRRAGESAVFRDLRTKVEDASHSGRSSKVAPARRPKRYFSRKLR